MASRRVVVTGMGVVSCFGNDVDNYYDNLLRGKSGVSRIENFPCENYPTQIAGEIKNFNDEGYIDPKNARRLDRVIKYAVVSGKKAWQDSKLDEYQAKLDKTRTGVIIGSGMGGMQTFENGVETLVKEGWRRISPFFVPHIITNMCGAFLAIDLDLMGPNYSISTACATANYSILAAAHHIKNGDADVMLTGGAEAPLGPMALAGFVACKALSQCNSDPEGASKPWDQKRDGFVIGEGAGVLVLEELEHAKARGATIYAEFLGGGLSCDAYHMTSPREDGLSLELCVNNALKDARIKKEDISYINAHATSTSIGDAVELRGMHRVFGKEIKKIKFNATKSMIGHGLGAAGGLEAIACIKAIRTGKLHPTINLKNPLPEVSDYQLDVFDKMVEADVNIAMSNSFGFGGHNSSIIFARFKG